MSDQDFQERVFEYFARLEEQRREDNQRIEKRLDTIEVQVSENAKSIGALAVDVGWIKGKLEAKREGGTALLSKIAVGTAICSAIIALIALFLN